VLPWLQALIGTVSRPQPFLVAAATGFLTEPPSKRNHCSSPSLDTGQLGETTAWTGTSLFQDSGTKSCSPSSRTGAVRLCHSAPLISISWTRGRRMDLFIHLHHEVTLAARKNCRHASHSASTATSKRCAGSVRAHGPAVPRNTWPNQGGEC
jgi:hypothetical protein